MSVLPSATFAGPSQAEALWAVAGSTGPGGGVTQLVAGANITLDPPTGEGVVTINASGGGGGGVTSIVAGAGIGVSSPAGDVTVSNTGVTSLVAGAGISLSGASGAVTVTNTGATVAPGYAQYSLTAPGQTVTFTVGSAGRILLGGAGFINPPGATGWVLNAQVTLSNPAWNANTIVLTTFGPDAVSGTGGTNWQGSTTCAYLQVNSGGTFPTPSTRQLNISGNGTAPVQTFSGYYVEFVAIQGV